MNVVLLHRETIRAPPKQRSRKVITGCSAYQGIEPRPASLQRTDTAHHTWST